MKVLVTGANGYLGQGIVSCLCDRRAEVVAADLHAEWVDPRARAVCGDLFAPEDPYTFYGAPDILLHLAWRDGFDHNAPSHQDDLPEHERFLRRMVESGVKKVCVMGTMHEVGTYEGQVDEDTPCRPVTQYGKTKDALRRAVIQLCTDRGIPYEWFRAFYIVGDTGRGCSVFSKLAAAARAGQAEFPVTTGTNRYDFLDYPEFCRQSAAAVLQDAVTGIVNLCSGRPERLSDRLERFLRENGLHIRLHYGAFPDRPYDSRAIWGNNEKISAILRRFGRGEEPC